ncbi:methyl-accepting chemotaxis protein [Geomonas paludis]|uniref:Methyl-accepting chemotaxis protein n=1 Tax=Geomonas paludis TaxID=2740185 RepID=A0ABY4LIF1_9BACT|nr:methyl-accepting chemotaxis protein [Geomonas paludis]UPU37604.1 methyl-accepting chemotaxis protein [Geomonas paludis]
MIAGGNDSGTRDAEVRALAPGWSGILAKAAVELAVIAGTTEDEFLAIGGRLQDFYQRGLGISGLASEMVGEVAGDQVIGAMDRLGEMLDHMGHYVDRAQNEIEGSAQTLREILGLLEKVSDPLSGFKKVNKVLRMLGISTKIESARLGQSAAGFDTLASDVGELSVQVNDKAAFIMKRKDDLAREIAQTLSGVLESGAQQHDRVIEVLARTRKSLQALTEINTRCSSSVALVSAVSDEVYRSIGDVVMSMQAHDIVRQQIEHVHEALDEVKQGLDAGSCGADATATICELQIAQLRHASDELDGAVRIIMESLREVARKQSGLSAQTSGMSGIADQAGGSFFTGMERDISVVSNALLESSKVNQALCVAMGTVAETVGEIATFVGDIEKIGEEIKLIALNAQIKSAYTGDEGAALGVLAEAIQRLSIDAINHTGAVSGTLQGIIGVTDRLSQGVSVETTGLESEVHGMVQTLSDLVQTLRQVNDTLQHSLHQMDDSVTRLSTDIEQVVSGITVHRKVAKVLEESIRAISGVATEARRLAPAGTAGNLDQLAQRYTMQSERRIHESLNGPATGGRMPTLSAPPPPAADEDELGGNVELF